MDGSRWMMVVIHLPFFLQVSLVHPALYSDSGSDSARWKPSKPVLGFLRRLLLPVNLWMAWLIRQHFCFTPATRRGPLNLQLACWVIHLAMKSIEWGLISEDNITSTYRLRKSFLNHPDSPPSQLDHNPDQKICPKNSASVLPKDSDSSSLGFADVLVWSFHQVTSLRGINYNWGWKGRNQAKPTFTETLRLALVTHAVQTIGLIGCVMCRDYGGPKGALLAMGVPDVWGVETVAELLSSLSWGILCSFGMEFSFCYFTMMAHLMNFIDHHIVRLPSGWMAWWDLRLFVPLFHDPFNAHSLASLWAFHWHQVYRRSFTFLGVLPASKLAQKLRFNLTIQRIFGLFGGFLVSGILHEAAITFVSRTPMRAGESRVRGSLVYFLSQPLGILIEPYVIRWIPAGMGGGRLWVLAFTLLSTRPFRDQYLDDHRVIDDLYLPLNRWPIAGFLWVNSIMQW